MTAIQEIRLCCKEYYKGFSASESKNINDFKCIYIDQAVADSKSSHFQTSKQYTVDSRELIVDIR